MARVGRNRERHKRLPTGWAPSPSGTIYFRPTNRRDREIVRQVTGGPMSLRLGATFDEAAETFARVIVAARRRAVAADPGTVAEIVSRARESMLPAIENAKTREERSRHLDELERLFGRRRYARSVHDVARDASLLSAADMQTYLDDGARPPDGSKPRPVAVNRAMRTWEIAWDWARTRWRLVIDYNPCAGLFYNPEKPRDVLPKDERLRRIYRRCDPPVRFLIAMIRYYGRRRVETLRLQLSAVQDDGLHLVRGKREKEIVIRWDPRLRRHVERVLAWRRKVEGRSRVKSTMLLLNRKGRPLTETGYRSAWRRAAERAGVHGEFTFHDIRALRATTLNEADAIRVLANDDHNTTRRVYRRGPHVIDLNRDAG